MNRSWRREKLPRWLGLWPLLCTVVALLLTACGGTNTAGEAAGTPLSSSSLQGSDPAGVHYLSMTDSVVPDPQDPGKKMLHVEVQVQADKPTSGVLAFLMIADPSTSVPWPRPAYANGSPAASAQKISLHQGANTISANFPLYVRKDGKPQEGQLNIQTGGFYDVEIFAGGAPPSTGVLPVASFQTSRTYQISDFGGPPATPTPTFVPTKGPSPVPTSSPYPTFTPGPTSTPTPTPTPVPPPFALGLLAIQTHDQLRGTVPGGLAGVGGTTVTPPTGDQFVVAIFVVRKDIPAASEAPLPKTLSIDNAGSWQDVTQHIVDSTGSLALELSPYGAVTIAYDPRTQTYRERVVVAQVWEIPASIPVNSAAVRLDNQPATAFPLANAAWVNPGYPYQLKQDLLLADYASVQVAAVTQTAPIATPGPAEVSEPAFKVQLVLKGSTAAPVTLRLQLLLENAQGLRTEAVCPVQQYKNLVAGTPYPFTCSISLPSGGKEQGFHLGVTGTINGSQIHMKWVTLPQ
ncbi:MAG: hypothetical protein M1118_09675 [Chloroflexi bacterium]|nr:hypothetical protein [Chloroflexota bacterium]